MRALRNKILVKIDTTQKERYDLGNGSVLKIERGFNFNLREDRGSMGYVVDGEDLLTGVPILIHHNASEETYRVEGSDLITDEEKRNGWKLLSIPKDMAFAYKVNNEWQPCKDFLITQRIFKPYTGMLSGIEAERVKKRLYIVKGNDVWDDEVTDLAGKVCVVTENSDYQTIFHNKENREETLIRTRWREIEAVDEGMSKDVVEGKYLVGASQSDAKQLTQNVQFP